MFGKSNVFILTTTGWAAFWAIFSQNHLVTLLDSSMNANFQVGAANSAPKMKCQISSKSSFIEYFSQLVGNAGLQVDAQDLAADLDRPQLVKPGHLGSTCRRRRSRVARFFLVYGTKTGKNMYQMFITYHVCV
jgi:hypothetical protein